MKLDRYIEIVKKEQIELKKYLYNELSQYYDRIVDTDGFLYAKGSIPIMLVAHMDTVHSTPPKTIWFSEDKNLIKADEGIGGDDRNGVAMILELIEKCWQVFEYSTQKRAWSQRVKAYVDSPVMKTKLPHILFTEDEEIGAVGAEIFTEINIRPDINFIVELDRRGSNDAVFYDCDNPEFTQFIESFGFVKAWGSFSDISTIAPHLEVSAVNLSSGYYNAHTKNEYVNLSEMDEVVEKTMDIIKSQTVSETTKKYEYIEKKYKYGQYPDYSYHVTKGMESKPIEKTESKQIETTNESDIDDLCFYCGDEAVTGDEYGLPICEKCAEKAGRKRCDICGEYFDLYDLTTVHGVRMCNECVKKWSDDDVN